MVEEWKDIPNFNGYQVSNFGRVKSLKRITKIPNAERIEKEKILKLRDNGNGYLIVSLLKMVKEKIFMYID